MAISAPNNYYSSAAAILNALNAPRTASNLNLLVAWMGMEHGWQADLSQCNNPFNTTWDMPGATNMNSVGVKCYPNASVGAQATVNTLTQGSPSYMTLVNALKNGNPNQFFSAQGKAELNTWSGGSNSYASTIQQIFSELDNPPASVMQSTAVQSSGGAGANVVNTLSNLFGLSQFDTGSITTIKQAAGIAVIGALILVMLWEGGEDLGL